MNTILGYLASQNKGIAKHSQRITDPHPNNETALPCFQFVHSCTYERFIYLYAAKQMDQSW
jgi:hypothetical protein